MDARIKHTGFDPEVVPQNHLRDIDYLDQAKDKAMDTLQVKARGVPDHEPRP
jgi:hypothetical protein